MSQPSHKEVHRIFYMVKGYIATDTIAYASYSGYIKRLWYNEESYLKEDGFEEAYEKKFKKKCK